MQQLTNPFGFLDRAQRRLTRWAVECFGSGHQSDSNIRGQRLVEEAVEFAQSVGVGKDLLHKLVDYVYERPKGEPKQELGGVGVTWVLAASSCGLRAAQCLAQEQARVLSKSPKYFAARNQAKVDAGFR